ncbi:MAG: peptidylprolyl isomerase [bacterium]
MKKHIDSDEKKVKVSTLVYGILILFVVVLLVGSILAYGTNTEIGNKIAVKIAKVIPFPAAIIGWTNIVYINDVEKNMASVQKFYQTQDFAKEGLRIDFTTENGKKRLRIKEREILDKMVEDKIIEVLSKERGLSFGDKDAEKVVSQKLAEFGSAEDFKADLLKSYGWDVEEFKQRIVLPGIYADALASKIQAEELGGTASAKEKILQAQKDLEAGKEFVQVVRMYSQGPSREKDGELGWAKKDQVLPQLQEALFGKSSFQKNSIIESSIGFHIVEIENSKKENGEDILQLRQIFVSKDSFSDWLDTQKKQMKVSLPLAEFTWDSKKGMVDFRDEKMREFEAVERAKFQGDASIMF